MSLIFQTTITSASYDIPLKQVTVNGQAFADTYYLNVSKIEASLTGQGVWTTVSVYDSWTDTQVIGTFASPLAGGVFDLRVTSSDGEVATLSEAFVTGDESSSSVGFSSSSQGLSSSSAGFSSSSIGVSSSSSSIGLSSSSSLGLSSSSSEGPIKIFIGNSYLDKDNTLSPVATDTYGCDEENYYVDNDLLIVLECQRPNTTIDISASTTKRIYYKKPNGTTGYWPATLYGLHSIQYDASHGNIDVAGVWRLRAYVVFNSGVIVQGQVTEMEILKGWRLK